VSEAPVQALSLDVDDTLIDTRAASLAAVPYAFDGALPPELADEAAAVWVADAGGHYETYEAGAISFDEQRRRRYVDLARALGLDASDAAFDAWVQRYEAALRRVRPYDEVPGFLDAVAARGIPVVLVTNYEVARQQAKLVGAGLADRFPLVVGTDTTGLPKPQPEPFRAACALLGLQPAAVLHVGDNLVSDVAGATSAGLQARWLERTGALPVPGGVERVTALREVLPLLG
jgi:putative hydrolase of the HAD superfamily